MSFLPAFSTWQFAAAGLACAAAPILIHLLNRRRYRTIDWAAMDFLASALKRTRRIIRLRDLVLMLLRAAAILLFGLALAQPHFSRHAPASGPGPVHLVLLVDTSLSMNYQTIDGTLLDQARDRAARLIEQAPEGSRISVVSVGGHGGTPKPVAERSLAVAALDRLVAADHPAPVTAVADSIDRAAREAPELPIRAVLLSDMQQRNWSDLPEDASRDVLSRLAVVDLAPADWENAWVTDLRASDGIADVNSPTTFTLRVHYSGDRPRDTQVTLRVDDTVIGSTTLSLGPGRAARQITFQHQFDTYQVEAGIPGFARITASLNPDRLVEDDECHAVLPVVAALPVVFVDQYDDASEDALASRLGESRHLRRLLAPATAQSAGQRPLIAIRHHTIEQLRRDLLADSRLVVIAGIRDPADRAPLLLDYVRQGGRLVVIAGGSFDPVAWTDAAWLGGAGFLPTPLAAEPIGRAIGESTDELRPMFIDLDGLENQAYFQVPDLAPEPWRDLYSEALFFKAVRPEWNEPLAAEFRRAVKSRLEADAAPDGTPRRAETPRWLLWAPPDDRPLANDPDDPAAQEAQWDAHLQWCMPRVVARLNDPSRTPLVVERRMGTGHVVFVSTGTGSDWNNLPLTNAFLFFDRLLRTLIHETLPRRNFAAQERLLFPLDSAGRGAAIGLRRPGAADLEPADAGFFASDRMGITIQPADRRGFYTLEPLESFGESVSRAPADTVTLSVAGDGEESDLTPLGKERLEHLAGDRARAGGAGLSRSPGLAGEGRSIWRWLAVAVLALMLAELVFLACINPVPAGGRESARGR